MTLAELHHENLRRLKCRSWTAADYGIRLVQELAKNTRTSYLELGQTGFVAGFGWAQNHRLIVFHRDLWQVSKLGREYLVLLENPRANAHDRAVFLEKARAETTA
jgi:hypothetical protein